MLPKIGRKIPPSAGEPPRGYAVSIAEALRTDLGSSHQAIKTLMRWTGSNERTAKNWLSGTNGPSGEHLLEIIRNSDLVFECVLQLVGRRSVLSHRNLEELRERLQSTTKLISEVMKTDDFPKSHQSSGPEPTIDSSGR
ncbi:hypothetical protein [Bradyrhizobium erythrophlei]|jgi:hypothetical protein|uniref:hypothetical protein n=1 Tax=Bradyrhizobium erythrophlei TaxID=1437360 RepID=UPI0009A84E4A|nr:hypothetical protein [Bradyrhizobium erythrophlei]